MSHDHPSEPNVTTESGIGAGIGEGHRGRSVSSLSGLPARRRRAWILTAAVGLGIIFLSTRPNLHPGPGVPHLDKVAHFVEYALLGWFAAGALRLSGIAAVPAALLALVGASLFGGMDEWIQSSVPGRDSCIADWAADSVGALAGVVCRAWWDSRLTGRGRRRQTRGGKIRA